MVKRLKNIAAWLLMLLIVALGLAACQTASGSFCAIAKPIRPTGADMAAISDSLAAQILAQDKTGEKLCGWKAK
ncbi:MAG TPA: hypothetical protein VFT89_07275 [Rhizobiaceae bacterium]|nr:hypothetical protein [Rhizobiaceae bacterium]